MSILCQLVSCRSRSSPDLDQSPPCKASRKGHGGCCRAHHICHRRRCVSGWLPEPSPAPMPAQRRPHLAVCSPAVCVCSYVYAPLPAATSYGHRAELWNPDKWMQVRGWKGAGDASSRRVCVCWGTAATCCTHNCTAAHTTAGGKNQGGHGWRPLLCAHAYERHGYVLPASSPLGRSVTCACTAAAGGAAGNTRGRKTPRQAVLCCWCMCTGELFAECPLPADRTPLTTVRSEQHIRHTAATHSCRLKSSQAAP